MPNQSYPTYQDVEPSWADIAITATVNGGALVDMADIAAVKWSSSVEVGVKKGASGGRFMARTVGEVSYEASVTFYRGGYRRLQKALAAQAPTRGNQKLLSLVVFDIMIQHTPPGEVEIYQTKIKGCRLLGASNDMTEGSDADKLEVTFSPMEVVQIVDGEEYALI